VRDSGLAALTALLVGVAAAASASAFYNLGLLLQAEATRREPKREAVHPALLARLVQRRRWIAGSMIALCGWPLQAFALTRAPLTVVQPALAVGLVLPLVLGTRMLGERPRRRDLLNVAVLAVGVSLLVVAAPPHSAANVAVVRLSIALAALAAVAAAAFLLTFRPGSLEPGTLLVVAAGLGFALASVTTKLFADALTRRAWFVCGVWGLATIVTGAGGLLGEMNALQVRAASTVASLVFALETAVPVVLSPILFGETGSASVATLFVRVAALAATLGAAVGLTRTPSVVEALAERPS
jgi:drug/metabolite transporter (DMT)-like permease